MTAQYSLHQRTNNHHTETTFPHALVQTYHQKSFATASVKRGAALGVMGQQSEQ